MSKKKLIFAVVIVLLAAAVFVLPRLLRGSVNPGYADTNGADNYTLQSIAEDELVGSISGSYYGGSEKERQGWHIIKGRTVNGVIDIARFDRDSFTGKFDIELDFSVDQGNVRLFLCTTDAIITDFNVNGDSQQYSFDCSEESVFLRIAGENCRYDLSYRVVGDYGK